MKFTLTKSQQVELMIKLKARFENNQTRHFGIEWSEVQSRLEANPKKLWSLSEMERTGGEPDVTGREKESGEYIFCDCAAESPTGRRSLCYDQAAREARKNNKPTNSALNVAEEMGIEMLNEAEYKELQKLGAFDTKTSSWIKTPVEIRKLGGAIFCDFRYGQVFVYHNGADSYYAARGFRGMLKV